ncbi:serine-type D-Ala-D-Ala carboxypeptidase [Mycoplasma sp. CAG:776]|nr:serine-type D-Ala-D-Ala carboxypeptidase [Mycoplasma sp. CAG:776]
MKKILIIILAFSCVIPIVKAEDSLNLSSESAILMDAESSKILYEKNIDEKLPMASMTKIMSMLLIMENIENGSLKYEDKVLISENASGMGGSQVFLQAGEEYTVDDLLKCIAVSSANDAVVAMAEKISGSVDTFVTLMNEKAKSLGLENTNFANPHGLDNENHYSTAYDMAIMAKELLKHEDILKYTSIYEDYLTKPDGSQVWLVNTNRLVRFYDGVDGLKTGYTTEAGYCLTATAKKNDLRLISVVMKSPSAEERSSDTSTLLTYGFNSFKSNVIYSKDKSLGKIKIEKGKLKEVDVYLKEDATEILSVTEKPSDYTFNIKIDKIIAPVKAGTIVGTTEIIDNEGNIIKEADIIVKIDVEKAGFLDYLKQSFKFITSGIS